MVFADIYRRQVALLIRSLPVIATESSFALKGGTAINLFYRDIPRLSVDIDLTYLPVRPRADSLADIDATMRRISTRLQRAIPGARVTSTILQGDGIITKLVLRSNDAQIKLEVTPVLRGCVEAPQMRRVAQKVEDDFGFAETLVVSFNDLYAGKIMAALDRQHPRDLFDVRDLLAAEGIDDALRRAFIVYLLSHHRPMAEVLASKQKDISQEFLRGFQGMTSMPVVLEELLAARVALVRTIIGGMPVTHRHFLVSFERGAPDWSLLGVANAADLPAVRWRQRNLDTLDRAKRDALVAQLETLLLG